MKGKGAQYNPSNPFASLVIGNYHEEGIDENVDQEIPQTSLFVESPKNVLSKNDSPDLKWEYSVNPYQGCEHGCVYCYARNSHTYWGFSAGLDFESKIIIKPDVADTLDKQLSHPKWKVQPVMLSGNTDCYQPVERKLRLTRSILEVMLKYRNPVSIITKNALIVRDLDLLKELSKLRLVHVYFSVTTMDDHLRGRLEPRTSSSIKRLDAMRKLSDAGVPVGVMTAPIIPGLNHHEIPLMIESAAQAGAQEAGYTVVRLNGQIKEIFENWIWKTYPERAEKVLNQIRELHGGKLNDSSWSTRLKGSGNVASMIDQLFRHSRKKYIQTRKMPDYNLAIFRKGGAYNLFEV